MEPIIRVEKLSKKYTISHQAKGNNEAFREVLTKKIKSIGAFRKDKNKETTEEFWALQDVSFEVNRGDRVGIIGRNGAGKSTLLKVLSQITEPTAGRVIINGRVSSLLEVGTGFHPELTGRENVFLNGAIMGMNKREIQSKFDEIVSFSEVDRFLDTPVKHYSSGMYVRLAFAVAAHLDPDILIVDEALAVGDAAFQKKCLGKMEEVSNQGRTILVVSHNMNTVMKLCSRAILLKTGKIETIGNTEEVINSYYNSDIATSNKRNWVSEGNKRTDETVRLLKVKAHDKNFEAQKMHDITKPIGISMEYEVVKGGDVFTHSFNLYNEEGIHIFSSHDTTSDVRNMHREKGIYTATMWIPGNFLAEGILVVSAAIIAINPFHIYFHEMDAVRFTVIDYMKGDSSRGNYMLDFPGLVRPLMQWQTEKN